MNLVQLTPGAGRMYCGNCLRDNALVRALRRRGHAVTMVPLYLPLTLDEGDESADTPIFFSGVNVYLDQKFGWFRRAPAWIRRWFTGRGLLRGVGRFAARTRAEEVGELMLSMLRGEAGNQARDLEELVGWLQTQPRPDVFCLSNALLMGLAGGLKRAFGSKVVCLLAGEDAYLEAMPAALGRQAYALLREQAAQVDRFLAPTRYFADRMADRLGLGSGQIGVVPTGLDLAGYPETPPSGPDKPVIGYLARMCAEKGLPALVDAFLAVRRRGRVPGVTLKVAGSCGPGDEPLVRELKGRLAAAGALQDVSFHPNLDRAAKVEFLKSLSVFSVPAGYGEAFGLYLIEALAAGAPAVQPRVAAFPEILEATGGGRLYDPEAAEGLAGALEELLLDADARHRFAAAGWRAVRELYAVDRVADRFLEALPEGVRLCP